MEKGRKFETIVGFFVLIVTIFFFNYVYTKSGWKKDDGYVLIASFDKADGLSEGVDVKISGVRVGKVLSTSVDPETFMGIVKFYVSNDMKLPKDTCAAVQSEGLFGAKYLALVPGGDDEVLKEGDTIYHTSSAINIESLIGQLMFSKNDSSSANEQNPEEEKTDTIEIFPTSDNPDNNTNSAATDTDTNTDIEIAVSENFIPTTNNDDVKVMPSVQEPVQVQVIETPVLDGSGNLDKSDNSDKAASENIEKE